MKVIRWKELKQMLGLSRSTVFRMIKAGVFPKHFQIGPNSVGWYEDEVIDFIRSLKK
jgi:prophage regulatory protein